MENRFGLAELNQGCGLWAMPTSLGVFGVSVQHSGDALYNESKLRLAYARTFGESLSGALKFSYQTTFLGNHYGSRNAFLVEGGFQLRLKHKTTLGAYVFNPNRTLLSVDEQEPYQSVFRLGMQYKLSEKVGLFAEAKKQSLQPLLTKLGMEYQWVPAFYLRTGMASNPFQNSFGMGYVWQQLQLDFALWRHPALGYVPQLSLSYQSKK